MFENRKPPDSDDITGESFKILGGKSSGPIRQDVSLQQPSNWNTQNICSGITNFKAGKQLKLED